MNLLLRRLAVSLILSLSLVLLPSLADAKAGGGASMGSRGARTFSAPKATPTAPSPAAPIQRSMTPTPAPKPSVAAPQAAPVAPQLAPSRSSFFSGLMGGMIGVGLAGMLFGHGFFGAMSGFGSFLGLLLQIGLVFLVVRLAIGFFRSRSGAPNVFAGPGTGEPLYQQQQQGYQQPVYLQGGTASASSTIDINEQDFNAFERLLGTIQAAWSKADLTQLRRYVTPEMLSYFSEQLAANASRGFENHVDQVKLLQGDLSEAWHEGDTQYATVAMRFQLADWNVDQSSGRIVQGDPARLTETTEIWTFMRNALGGNWLLSAIQQAA